MDAIPPTFHSIIAGVSHRPMDAKIILQKLNLDDHCLIERDPHNQYDRNAVKVYDEGGEYMLGFIRKEVAADLAPWMDRGWMFTCTVVDIPKQNIVNLRIEPVLPSQQKEEVSDAETSRATTERTEPAAA